MVRACSNHGKSTSLNAKLPTAEMEHLKVEMKHASIESKHANIKTKHVSIKTKHLLLPW